MLKAELEQEVERLKELLEIEQNKSRTVNISDCDLDMGDALANKVAIAEAVKEGMKVLQKIADG